MAVEAGIKAAHFHEGPPHNAGAVTEHLHRAEIEFF